MPFDKVYLEPIAHKYYHKERDELKFTSVTQVVNKFVPQFDEDSVSMAIAMQSDENKNPLYIGMSQTEILAEWKRKNDAANDYGNLIHDTMEQYLLSGRMYPPSDEFKRKITNSFEELVTNKLVDLGEKYNPERIVWSEEYNIAGSMDLPIEINHEYFDILDYKTNEVFSYYAKYSNGATFKAPFDYLQNCKYSMYTAQLSIYAFLYEKMTGKKCRRLAILYWDRVNTKFEIMPVFYAKDLASKMVEYHKILNN